MVHTQPGKDYKLNINNIIHGVINYVFIYYSICYI